MRLDELAKSIGAAVVTNGHSAECDIRRVYAGDRVSDLLTQSADDVLLVSNLAGGQLLRVAELMDVPAVCIVAGASPDARIVAAANASGTCIIVSPVGMFETCALLHRHLVGGRAAPT